MSDAFTTALPPSAAERARAIDDARARFAASEAPGGTPPRPAKPRAVGRKLVRGAASLLLIGTGAFVGNRVAGVVLGGHDHPTAASSTPTALTREQAADTYRALVTPVNAAQTTFAQRIDRWTAATSSSDASHDALPLANALRDAHAELEQLGRDYGTAPDVFDRAVKAVATVEADIARIVQVNVAITVEDWRQIYDRDLVELTDSANAVRTELGLPRAGTATTPVAMG